MTILSKRSLQKENEELRKQVEGLDVQFQALQNALKHSEQDLSREKANTDAERIWRKEAEMDRDKMGKMRDEYSVKIAFQEREIEKLKKEIEVMSGPKNETAPHPPPRAKSYYFWIGAFSIFFGISLGAWTHSLYSKPKPVQDTEMVYYQDKLGEIYRLKYPKLEADFNKEHARRMACQQEWRQRGTDIANLTNALEYCNERTR